MTTIENRIKIIGKMACKNHKFKINARDYLNAPLQYYIENHPYHEVFDLGNKLVYKCPNYKEYRKLRKNSLLHLTSDRDFTWIEDDLRPYKPTP
jgi:hypothetical protein